MLTARFRYLSSYGQITVPPGFQTDGASIPRCFWNIFSPFDATFGPAVIHDFLYSRVSAYDFDRAEADLIFKEAMFNVGIRWPKREAIYRAVRAFGWSSYKTRMDKLIL